MSYNRSASVVPDRPVNEVKCANNIGIKVFAANPFVSRETGTALALMNLTVLASPRQTAS
jgi:hypothetical protein